MLGDAFVGQNLKHQVRAIGESAAKLLWRVTPSVKHALSAKVWRCFVAKFSSIKINMHFIAESAVKLAMWPVTPSSKHALSGEVCQRFCGPKFQVPNV